MTHCAVVPQLAVVAGHPVTTSLNIADVFGKKHKHVLDAIEHVKNESKDIDPEFSGPNFRPGSYPDAQGQLRPMYNITRNGFTVLVMGFTGKRAFQFKLAYIAEFDRMESELHALAEFGAPASNLSTGQGPVTVARLAEAAQGIKAAMIMARGLGYRNAQAVKIANSLVRDLTGIDALELLGPIGDEGKPPALPLAVDQPPAGWVDEKTLAEFIAESCELEGSATTSGGDLFRAYSEWLKARQGEGWPLPSVRQFHQLVARHFRPGRATSKHGLRDRLYHGVKIAGAESTPTLYDHLNRFLDECCELKPEWRAGATDLYDSFRVWWKANVESAPLSQKMFGNLMVERFERCRIDGRYLYQGLALAVRAGEVNHG